MRCRPDTGTRPEQQQKYFVLTLIIELSPKGLNTSEAAFIMPCNDLIRTIFMNNHFETRTELSLQPDMNRFTSLILIVTPSKYK
jgi:hypothetical protein